MGNDKDFSHGEYVNYDEFLAWADEDRLAEWVDGKVVLTSPASAQHQYLAIFLATSLSTYVTLHDLGTVLTGPFQMKLARSGREPDVLFVAKEHLARLQPTLLQGPADLVVEIVSDESVARDRGTKFEEYREAGIPEYWLLDPRIEQAEFYLLDERGRYQRAPVDEEGVYRSRVIPGLWLRVDWLWQQPLPSPTRAQQPLPSPTRALLEIDRDAYLSYFQEQLRQTQL